MTIYTSTSSFNVHTKLPNSSQDSAIITQFIELCEREYMQRFFGVYIYNLIKSNPTSTQWNPLKVGIVFLDSTGQDNKWEGFGQDYQNPIAAYTKYRYCLDTSMQATGIGVTVNNAENAKVIDPYPAAVSAWNDMVDYNTILHELVTSSGWFTPNNPAVYDAYPGTKHPPIFNPSYKQLETLTPFQKLFVKKNRLFS